MPDLLPNFARVEIRLSSQRDLAFAATHLRTLADELDFLSGTKDADDALVLAHHYIRRISQRLRTGAENDS